MLPQKVIFKGVRDGIMVIIDGGSEVDELIDCLSEHSRLGRDFFSGSTALLDIRDGELADECIDQISKYLISEMGFVDVKMSSVSYKLNGTGARQITGTESNSEKTQTIQPAGLGVPNGDATMFVKRTLRSGQKVNYVGNVIIMGDVNPGAEVVAGGDIIVLGSLRGVAHAGATGVDSSLVWALKLQPTQLRIANFIARPPDGDNRVPTAPEVASIKDGRLVIESYSLCNRV